MLILYSIPESLYSAKLRIVMRHKGVAFAQDLPPGGYGSDAYKQVVPAGTVPAIVHDGFILADSEAIAEYLEEVWPNPAMLPAGAQARARARERSRFHDTRLEPEIRVLFGQMAPQNRDQGFIAQQATLISTRLMQLERLIADWNGGLTLGDCGFPASFVWLDAFFPELGSAIEWPNAVRDYRDALAAMPAVSQELETYQIAADAWVAAKLAI